MSNVPGYQIENYVYSRIHKLTATHAEKFNTAFKNRGAKNHRLNNESG